MALISVSRAWIVVGLAFLAGCEAGPGLPRLDQLYTQYKSGDYRSTYQGAVRLRQSGPGDQAHEAAYLAALAAYKLKSYDKARQFLATATRSADRRLTGEASAMLGLIHAKQGRHRLAARAQLDAAARLSGQDEANAYYYAALSQQKLGQWSQARTSLLLARGASVEREFRQRVSDQIRVTGFTLQQGAYRVRSNANRVVFALASRSVQARLGPPRIVTATDAKGQPLYLVHVGRFSSFGSASMASQRLREPTMMVVPLATLEH